MKTGATLQLRDVAQVILVSVPMVVAWGVLMLAKLPENRQSTAEAQP